MIRKCAFCGDKLSKTRQNRSFCSATCTQVANFILNRAGLLVRMAVAQGAIPNAKRLICSGCGRRAFAYDHRDYTKPFLIKPVCRECNGKLGPGRFGTDAQRTNMIKRYYAAKENRRGGGNARV